MSFWEKHKNALTSLGLVLFLLLVAYIGWIRTAVSDAGELRKKIQGLKVKLKKDYPRLIDPNKTDEPWLAEIQRKCVLRRREYERQLERNTARLRFPFKKDFPWVEVPLGFQGKEGVPGEYLIKKYVDVQKNVDNYHPPKSHTQLLDGWLGFDPDPHPDKVKVKQAEDKLRMLALAERLTKLAIDQNVGYVIKVRPAKVTPEAAYSTRTVRKAGKKVKVRVAYDNRFIINYPVTMEMLGSIDSIMNFFKSVHGDEQFLVIRTFKIINSAGGALPPAVEDSVKAGDLYVRIEAACMDFVKDGGASRSTKTTVKKPPSNYKPPTRPTGH